MLHHVSGLSDLVCYVEDRCDNLRFAVFLDFSFLDHNFCSGPQFLVLFSYLFSHLLLHLNGLSLFFLELVSSPLIFPLVRFRARTKRGFLYGVAFLGFLKGQHR